MNYQGEHLADNSPVTDGGSGPEAVLYHKALVYIVTGHQTPQHGNE